MRLEIRGSGAIEPYEIVRIVQGISQTLSCYQGVVAFETLYILMTQHMNTGMAPLIMYGVKVKVNGRYLIHLRFGQQSK